ncbi:glycoside hydrolase family 72 protein [Daldinia grandis]|nr:glycoside hydrolase family 72 protein [Daldinia grandis]
MAHSVTPVTIQGRYFWQGNLRFIMNGIVYNSSTPCADMLVDDRIEDLEKAIPLLTDLMINTLFTSHIDETKSHRACMSLLAEHGIYVLVSLGSVCHIVNHNASMMSYTSSSMQRSFEAIENLASYPNLLGFVVPNNPIKDLAPAVTVPVIRAIVRDTRRYLKLLAVKKHQRIVPVGIISLDKSLPLRDQFEYHFSGDDNETADFFFEGITWDTGMEMQTSESLEVFSNTHVPVSFLYGNNFPQPRPFLETRTIYTNPGIRRIFSGGIMFQFLNGPTKYGLVPRLTDPKYGILYYIKTMEYRNLCNILRSTFATLPASIVARSPLVEAAAMSGTKPKRPDPDLDVLKIGQAPPSPVDWTELETRIIDDSEWVDAGKEWLDLSVEDLAVSIWDKLNFEEADA